MKLAIILPSKLRKVDPLAKISISAALTILDYQLQQLINANYSTVCIFTELPIFEFQKLIDSYTGVIDITVKQGVWLHGSSETSDLDCDLSCDPLDLGVDYSVKSHIAQLSGRYDIVTIFNGNSMVSSIDLIRMLQCDDEFVGCVYIDPAAKVMSPSEVFSLDDVDSFICDNIVDYNYGISIDGIKPLNVFTLKSSRLEMFKFLVQGEDYPSSALDRLAKKEFSLLKSINSQWVIETMDDLNKFREYYKGVVDSGKQ